MVTDQSGAVLNGVAVTATNLATALTREVATTGDGRFTLLGLPVGTYRLDAHLSGFEPLAIPELVLPLGSSLVADLTLKVAGLRYDVVVPPRSVFDRQRPGVGRVIERAEIDQLPINIRNFLDFAVLAPTAAADRTPQQGASRTSGLTFSGQHARSNNVTVDGLDNNDETVGSVRAVFGQDAVEELQVLANGFSAEFGKASGGVVNIVTRSGTNTPRGGGFAYFRDDALNAKGYFERFTPGGEPVGTSKAPYGQWQLGASFGGPIRRDRTFVFASLERLTVDASNLVTIDDRTPVPDPLHAGGSLGTAADILRRAGFVVETGHVPYRVRSTQWLARIDQSIGSSQRLTVRTNGASELNENIEPFGGLIARSRAAVLENRDDMAAVSYNLAASGGLMNEARALVARRNQDVRALDPACDGECDREDEGGPTLEIGGVASVGRQRFTPTPRDNVRYQLIDTLTLARGQHLLKAGVDASFLEGIRQALPLHFGGRYIFTGIRSIPGLLPAPVSSIQAVALGLPVAYVQGYGFSGAAYDSSDLNLFVDDTWWAHERLSFRYGARYQRQFWPKTPYHTPGVPGPYTYPSDGNNIAPRLLVTWSPAAETVLRGGYGLYFENTLTATAGVTRYISGGPDGVRTLVLTAPAAFAAWAAPGRRLSEEIGTRLAGGSYPSVTIPIDPGLRTAHAHQASLGIERQLPRIGAASVTAVFARGSDQLGTIDYNPVVPELGPGRRPADLEHVAGTSASVLQYTSWGETWYGGLSIALRGRYRRGASIDVTYTLSKAEDTATDFQSAFLPQDNGRGRDPRRPAGLPIEFRPRDERGPALFDQRHRLVASGAVPVPGGFICSAIVTIASGWPFNILAGADLNGDRDGGSFPSDRARRSLADPDTSLSRNAGRFPAQAGVDIRVSRDIRLGRMRLTATLDVFNLLNRTNFTDVQNVFGTGAYPTEPGATFGQFTQAGPPRQAQLGVRVAF